MKVKLFGLEKVIGEVKTEKKTFKIPHFEKFSESPILELPDEQLELLLKFFYEFNGLCNLIQMGVHQMSPNMTNTGKEEGR